MARLVSPNEMLTAAKEHMLNGNDPETIDEWIMVMNFVAYNLPPNVNEAACMLFKTLYEMPLSDEIVKEIVAFQNDVKASRN